MFRKYSRYRRIVLVFLVSLALLLVLVYMSNMGNISQRNKRYQQIGSSSYYSYKNDIYYKYNKTFCSDEITCGYHEIFEKIDNVKKGGFVILDSFLPKAMYNDQYYYKNELLDKEKIDFDFQKISRTWSTEINFYDDGINQYCGKFPYELTFIGKVSEIEKKHMDKVRIGGKIIDATCEVIQ